MRYRQRISDLLAQLETLKLELETLKKNLKKKRYYLQKKYGVQYFMAVYLSM